MGKVLGIVYRAISTHLIHKAGLQPKDGATGGIASFRWEGFQFCNTQSATKPLKTSWQGLLRAFGQEWTDMKCGITHMGRHSVR